eukprot:SM000204S05854  [mRNA]  locus=s204:245930:248621:+ [translate_table: standard]
MAPTAGDWTVVRRRSSRSGRGGGGAAKAQRPKSCSAAGGSEAGPDDGRGADDGPEAQARLLEKLGAARRKVEASAFFQSFREQVASLDIARRLRVPPGDSDGAGNEATSGARCAESDVSQADAAVPPPVGVRAASMDLVVYGIGSLEHSEVARCQLGLAGLLATQLQAASPVWVYDPVLTALERTAMKCLGCECLPHNEEGLRRAERPTVFYMPHCEVELYENVLLANAESGLLGQVAILGNSFGHYQWSAVPFPNTARPDLLLKTVLNILACSQISGGADIFLLLDVAQLAQSSTVEHPVQDGNFPLISAFNDLRCLPKSSTSRQLPDDAYVLILTTMYIPLASKSLCK